jgi:hypothetical protein
MAFSKATLIHRRLYRALLRAAKPFSPPSPNAAVLASLLHRSFIPVEHDERLSRKLKELADNPSEQGEITFLGQSFPIPEGFIAEIAGEGNDERNGHSPRRTDAHFVLFRRLLCRLFAEDDNSYDKTESGRCLQYPTQLKNQSPNKFRDLIRREFRVPDYLGSSQEIPKENAEFSAGFTIQQRRDVAFLALRKFNEKLAWADELKANMPAPVPRQPAKDVSLLNTTPPSSCLQPGTFLVAHPHLTGYFRRTVICILEHTEPPPGTSTEEAKYNNKFGTYGLVINRASVDEISGKNRTLAGAVEDLAEEVDSVFGSFPIREGGPVHPTVQMLHACHSYKDGEKPKCIKEIGGIKLPPVPSSSNKPVYFRGRIEKAVEAILTGDLDRGKRKS